MSIKTYKASEIVSQYAKLDADPDFIRVADIPVEALQVAISTMEGIAHRNINTVHGHGYALRMHRRIDQLRALLAAVTGGNNER